MGKVIWTQSGLDGLSDLMDSAASVSPEDAARFGTRVVEAPRVLADWSRCGSIVPEFGVDHIRELGVRPYRIIYVIREGDCYVVGVVHGSRDLGKLYSAGEFEQAARLSSQADDHNSSP